MSSGGREHCIVCVRVCVCLWGRRLSEMRRRESAGELAHTHACRARLRARWRSIESDAPLLGLWALLGLLTNHSQTANPINLLTMGGELTIILIVIE